MTAVEAVGKTSRPQAGQRRPEPSPATSGVPQAPQWRWPSVQVSHCQARPARSQSSQGSTP